MQLVNDTHLIQPRFANFFMRHDLFQPLRCWLEAMEIRNARTARRIAKLIPAQCPFERDVRILGHTVAHIPPLCKLNPLYEQLVILRFRALCYLADECGEDIRSYC
jgi:Mo-dependent nitrogenase C-terminus